MMLLFNEIFHLNELLVGLFALFYFGTEQGGTVKKSPCIWLRNVVKV